MAKDFESLKQQALVIKNEVEDGANSSERIGGILEYILDYNNDKLTELEQKIEEGTGLEEILNTIISQDIGDSDKITISQKAITNLVTISEEGNINFDSFLEKNKYINSAGNLSAYNGYNTTDYIPVKTNDRIHYSLRGGNIVYIVAFYSSEKAFIPEQSVQGNVSSEIQQGEFVVKQDGYLRICTQGYGYYSGTIRKTLKQDYNDKIEFLSMKIDSIPKKEYKVYWEEFETKGRYVGKNGQEGTYGDRYNISAYIFCNTGDKIKYKAIASNGLLVLAYYDVNKIINIEKSIIGIGNSDTTNDGMFTAEENCFIRISSASGGYYIANYQEDSKEKIGCWMSLGTSITWYNDNSQGKFQKGYQNRVMDIIPFSKLINLGVNAGCMAGTNGLGEKVDEIITEPADFFTIEHGINDWGNKRKVGTMDDYINDTGIDTFYGAYRKVIDKIYSVNINAKIILCTPRKGYGLNSFLPPHWYDQKEGGNYLKDYVDAIIDIAQYMSIPICDWFNESGANQTNLRNLSIDDALHPNDNGYELMANLLIHTFKKIIVE